MYSCHSILEYYNLFSGVKLGIRSFFQISLMQAEFNPIMTGVFGERVGLGGWCFNPPPRVYSFVLDLGS